MSEKKSYSGFTLVIPELQGSWTKIISEQCVYRQLQIRNWEFFSKFRTATWNMKVISETVLSATTTSAPLF